MRYSYTALALALATATQVTAQPSRHAARHGHSQFHAKKDAETQEKRDIDWANALAGVDWSSALADVDWSTVSITYSAGQTFGESTAAAVAPAPATSTSVAVTTTPAAAKPVEAEATSSAAPAPATTFATSATAVSSAKAAVATKSSSSSSSGSDIVSDILSGVEEAALLAYGVISSGMNALTGGSQDVWIGTDGPYTMAINNAASESLMLVAWGPDGSWINANKPLVTLYLPAGSSKTLSFANGASGALSAFYSDTKLVNGQLSNTWVEFTMSNDGVFDISKEVNMDGHDVEVVGPACTSNMTTCVFQCADTSVTSCEYDYELVNCANGSQEGAQFGTYAGAASGGCGGLGESAAMTATFS